MAPSDQILVVRDLYCTTEVVDDEDAVVEGFGRSLRV